MNKGEIRSYKDLLVWQKGIEFVNEIYFLTKKFPKEEIFGLTSQMRRAAVAIPSNIAEGWGRSTTKNYIQFIRISRGSLFEIETMIQIAKDQQYLSDEQKTSALLKTEELGKMINKLLHSLEKYLQTE